MDSIEVAIKKLGDSASRTFEGLAKVVLSILMVAILFAMGWAVFKLVIGLIIAFNADVHESLKAVIVNSLTILALLEVFRTVLAYFSEGRVRVTYIIDTGLVVILTEVMAFWFRDIEQGKVFMMIALVLSLVVTRILTIRFSPGNVKTSEEL